METKNLNVSRQVYDKLNSMKESDLESFNNVLCRLLNIPVTVRHYPLRFECIRDMKVNDEIVLPWALPRDDERAQASMNRAIDRAIKHTGYVIHRLNEGKGITLIRIR